MGTHVVPLPKFALSRSGEYRMVPLLIERLSDPDPVVAHLAFRALREPREEERTVARQVLPGERCGEARALRVREVTEVMELLTRRLPTRKGA